MQLQSHQHSTPYNNTVHLRLQGGKKQQTCKWKYEKFYCLSAIHLKERGGIVSQSVR